MKKRRIARDVVVLLVSTLITITAWVGFEVYRAYTRVSLPEGVEKYLTPLEPTLDIGVLEILEKRGL